MSFDLSPEKLALLDALLEDESDAPIARRTERNRAPLSHAQERLWFVERLLRGSPAYNIPVVIDLEGELDVDALERAFARVHARHELLRARIGVEGDRPYWVLEDRPVRFERRIVDEDTADALERDNARSPFDLERGPLWRVLLLRISPTKHRLLLTMHHIISEAWTCALVLREVSAIMRGEVLPEVGVDYGDFAVWQRNADHESGLAYFADHLAAPPVLELPADRPRRATRRFVGGWVERTLSPERTESWLRFLRERGATLHMGMLAAYGALLHRWTGQTDIVVGTPVSLRTRVELESIVGYFVNTLAIRQHIVSDAGFTDLLETARDASLDALTHRTVPFEQVVERIAPERSVNQNPVFQVALVVQDVLGGADWRRALDLPGIEAMPRIRPSGTSKFDLTLEAEEGPEGLRIALEYDSDLLDRDTAEAFLDQLDRVMAASVAEPERPIAELSLMSEATRQRVLVDWNPADGPVPRDTIHERFRKLAREQPHAIAVLDGDQRVTYGDLDRWSDAIATRLARAGTERGEIVAIAIERSAALIAAMLGTLKAGAAYMPLDASYPPERRAFMLEDARARLVLAREPYDGALEQVSVAHPSGEQTPPRVETDADSLAYVLYTSGSTGRPKGVMTPHRGVLRLVCDTTYVVLRADDVLPQVANASFDAITFEVWGALLNRGRVVVLSREVIIDPRRLAKALRDHDASVMFLTVALFNRVAAEVPDAFATLRTLLVGGEALDPKWIRRVLRHGPPKRLLNGYGPTEVTTFALTHHITDVADDATSIPIGRAISNTRAYVLDDRMQLVPPGLYGELYLGGPGVALGYLRREELTRERFVPNPFGDGVLYRTGDWVRWLRDGTIDFAGRRDLQVKLRGFRIELGEIEARLEANPSVDHAVCVVRGEPPHRRLVAFVTGGGDLKSIESDLRGQVPAHMVPSTFVHIDELPLDPNGKVNRRALPDRGANEARAPLRTATERAVGRAFGEVVGATEVGGEDDFFALGGNSLLALPLARILSERFGVDLPLATLFRASTVRALAEELDGLRARPPKGTETLQFGPLQTGRIQAFPFDPLVRIREEGSRTAIYCVHGAGGNVVSFRALAQHLDASRPFYALQARGIDGIRRPLESIEAMARLYVEAILEHDPSGTYLLAGYSGGGIIAFEMAHQLRARGHHVSAVVMLDAGAGRPIPETVVDKQARRLRGIRDGGLGYVKDRLVERLEWDRWRVRAKVAELAKGLGRPLPHALRNRYMVEAFTRARNAYVLRPIDVPLIVLSARLGTRAEIVEAELGWKAFAPSVRLVSVSGDHGTLLVEPHVRDLAEALQVALTSLAA